MNKIAPVRALRARLPQVVFWLCILQPLLDVVSYWLDALAMGHALTMLLRLLMLAFILALGFCLSQRKKAYIVLLSVLAAHMLGHSLVCLRYGYDDPIHDLTNLIRIYQLPVATFAFITFMEEDKAALPAMEKGFLGSLMLIFLVEVLAALTGTDPHTYANKGIGLLGWFSNTSAQSAILSMLVPVAISGVLQRTKLKLLPALGVCALGFFMLFMFATRLSFASLIGCALGFLVSLLILRQPAAWKKIAALFLVFVLAAVLLVGVSPMAKNTALVNENARKKQEDILQLVEQDRLLAENAGLSEDEVELAQLKSAYEKYLYGVAGRFGLEQTAEIYGYSTDVSMLSNTRLLKINYCKLLLQEQPLSLLFGLELRDLSFDGGVYDVENDFHGILYLCGGVGLLLSLAFLGYFLLRIGRALILDFKGVFGLQAAGLGIALICGLVHAYATAGVLRRPNSSIYLALLLAAAFTLTKSERRPSMNILESLQKRLEGKLPKLMLVLFLLQPVMDVLSFWLAKLDISNIPTLLLRFLVLGVTLVCGFALSRNRKVYYIAAGICAFIGIGHMVSCFIAGYQNIFTDLSNYIRVLQLPITALCFITFLKADEGCYEAMKKGIVWNITIILAVQVLAIVTGTEPHTYDDGSGFIGWFSNTNTQSSILTMIAPVAVVWLYQKKGFKSVWLWIVLLGSCLSMYFIGTRLCYLGIVAMCFGIGASMILIRLKDWKRACVFLLVGLVFIAALPFAPMMGHRSAHEEEMELKQGWVQIQISQNKNPEKEEDEYGPEPIFPTDDLNLTRDELAMIDVLGRVYEHYVSDLVSVFGVERTIDMFGYTSDIVTITNVRDKKLMFAEVLMQHSPVTAQFFGIELDRFTAKGHIFDVENDFHGIYYLYGGVGLAAMLAFLGYFLFIIVKALVKDFKKYFTLEAAVWGIALIMCLGHCYFTASTLRRPSSSFYLAAVLAAVYYLVKVKKYKDTPEV